MAVKTLCRLQTSLGAAEVAILELGDGLTNPEHSIAVGERHLGCQGVHVYKKQTRVAAPFHPSEDESVRNSQGALPPPVGRLPTPMPRSIPTSSKDLALSPPVPALSPRAPAQANEGLNPRGWPGPSKQAFPGPEAQVRSLRAQLWEFGDPQLGHRTTWGTHTMCTQSGTNGGTRK